MGADWYISTHPLLCIHRVNLERNGLTKAKENVAQDLESFARHAGRTTITTDDVMLITRRNEALGEIMKDFVDREKAEKEQEKGAKKGKGPATGRGR